MILSSIYIDAVFISFCFCNLQFTMSSLDPTSYANSESIVTTHIHVDWDINFSETKLVGSVELSIQAQEDVDQIVSNIIIIYLYISTVYLWL